MAADSSAARDDKPSAADDDAIAPALQNQQSLISAFEKWLTQRTEADGELNGVIAKVQRRLDNYKQWLLQAQQTPHDVSEDIDPWLMDARVRSGPGDGSVIVVTGPGAGEPIEITPKDEGELGELMGDSCMGYMIKICHAFSKAQDTLRSLLQALAEVEREKSQLSQSPETTVKTYIRRLQEYNDIKDIGQQLIGLIAENRGVPVRTLYEKEEYGVGIPRQL